MMASSLRNRGMDNFYATRLEQGIYDLALAERFGPLDSQAVSWMNSAAFFIYANSYFGLDWSLGDGQKLGLSTQIGLDGDSHGEAIGGKVSYMIEFGD